MKFLFILIFLDSCLITEIQGNMKLIFWILESLDIGRFVVPVVDSYCGLVIYIFSILVLRRGFQQDKGQRWDTGFSATELNVIIVLWGWSFIDRIVLRLQLEFLIRINFFFRLRFFFIQVFGYIIFFDFLIFIIIQKR